MSVFATWLQTEFAARGWDQRDAARYIGVRESAIHNWLYQGYTPQTKSILKIAAALSKSVEEVMRAARIDVPTGGTTESRVADEAAILASNPQYREVIRMIAQKPPDKQQVYLELIKRLLSDG